MHATRKFRRQCRVNHPVPVNAALPPEGLRHNINTVVRFSPRAMAGMTLVLVGFVHHA